MLSPLKPSHRVFMQIFKTFVAFALCSMCFGFVYPGGQKSEHKSYSNTSWIRDLHENARTWWLHEQERDFPGDLKQQFAKVFVKTRRGYFKFLQAPSSHFYANFQIFCSLCLMLYVPWICLPWWIKKIALIIEHHIMNKGQFFRLNNHEWSTCRDTHQHMSEVLPRLYIF